MSSSLNMSFSDSNSTIHSSSSSSGSSSSLSSLNSSSSSSSSSSSCSSIDMELAPFLAKSSNGNEAARKKIDDEILDMENSMNGYSSHTSRHLHHLVHGSSAANNILQNLLLYIRSQVPPYRYLLQFVFFGVPILLVCYFLFLIGFAAFDHGFFDPNVEDKIMVIYPSEELPFELTKAQGAFSDFVAVIGAILYGQFYGAAAIKVYYNNPLYVDADRGDNYFDYFYKTSLIPLKPHLDLTKCCEEIHFNNWIARFGKFGTFSRFVIGHNQRPHQDKFPFKPFRSRNDLSTVIQQYIHPQTFVEDKVNSLIQDEWLFSRKYEEERQNVIVVGVHYRGTDKKALYPYRSPSYAVFDYYIRQVFYLQSIDRQIKAATSSPASSSLSLSNFVLFVATDEVEFIEWVQKRFSSIHVSFLKDSPRLSKTPEPGVDVETTGTHKSKRFSGFQKGFTSLVDCLLLAKTDYIVKTRSSLSDVALMYNPKINFTILLGPNDKEYSTDNRLVGPEKISIWDDPNPTNAYDPVADAKLWKEKFRRR